LSDLPTPALVLDRAVLARNCARMTARAKALGVDLRPHLKTAKSAEVARIATAGHSGGITVSTLAEARYFAERGFRDITYAVGLAPNKIEAVAALQKAGVRLTLVTDSEAMALAANERAAALGTTLPVLVELDTGDGRAGVLPDSNELMAVAATIQAAPALDLAGVLTHAGQSYKCRDAASMRDVAETERAGAVRAAERLKRAGLPCPVVSVGSTPTATFAERLDGVAEIRPGVYTLMDLFQMSIGVCAREDLACSVLATVIGHNRRTGRILTDAGGLALSKDVSARDTLAHVGYGFVADERGRVLDGLHVAAVSQEHGQIAAATGEPPWDRLPIGARLRVLPNHVCMMAAPYDRYHVVERDGAEIVAVWDKATGW
jgi:D-serine deaminase-like pyridoxal phosphate-dependent protein